MTGQAFEAAINLARQLVATFHSNQGPLFILQRCQLAVGDFASAHVTLQMMEDQQKKGLPGVMQAMAEDKWEEAEMLAQALAEQSQTSETANNLASIQLLKGQLNAVGIVMKSYKFKLTGKRPQAFASLSAQPTKEPSSFYGSSSQVSNFTAMLELLQSGAQDGWTKMRLLSEAAKWAPDGLPAECFKL